MPFIHPAAGAGYKAGKAVRESGTGRVLVGAAIALGLFAGFHRANEWAVPVDDPEPPATTVTLPCSAYVGAPTGAPPECPQPSTTWVAP